MLAGRQQGLEGLVVEEHGVVEVGVQQFSADGSLMEVMNPHVPYTNADETHEASMNTKE